MNYSPFRHLGSAFFIRRPIQLTFFLTASCNARCSFCFYLSRPKPAAKPPELTVTEIEKVSASLGKLLWLAFSGGEIFLRRDVEQVAAIFYKHNQPAIILLPTNGLLTETILAKTELILQNCPKSTIVVKLSLDGLEALHDSLRGVPGAFQKTMNTYQALSPLLGRYPNLELGINSVFCLANQDKMDELIDFVAGLDQIRTHTVSLIRGEVIDGQLKEVDMAKYYKAVERLAANLRNKLSDTYHFKGARLKAAQDILQRRLIHETVRQQRRLIPCYAGRLNLVLTETGGLYPCESFDMPFGNVRESGCDVGRLLKSGPAQKILTAIKNNKCYCTHECYFMTNILFNPALYPALLKEYRRL